MRGDGEEEGQSDNLRRMIVMNAAGAWGGVAI
jgi:hypothetical protein